MIDNRGYLEIGQEVDLNDTNDVPDVRMAAVMIRYESSVDIEIKTSHKGKFCLSMIPSFLGLQKTVACVPVADPRHHRKGCLSY